MAPTKLLTVFIKKTLIFSKMVDKIHIKMLPINEKYRVEMQRCYDSIDLQRNFYKYLVICNDSIKAFNSVYSKNIDFLKKGRLNLSKNA